MRKRDARNNRQNRVASLLQNRKEAPLRQATTSPSILMRTLGGRSRLDSPMQTAALSFR